MSASKHISPPWGRTTKAIVAVSVLLLLAISIWRFRDLISPLITAVILAYLLNPLIVMVMARLKVERGRGVLIVYVVILALLVGGGFALTIISVNQVADIISNFPELLAAAIESLQSFSQGIVASIFASTLTVGPFTFDPARLLAQLDAQQAVRQIVAVIEPFVTRGGSFAAWLAQATVRVIGSSFLILVFSIYIATDMPRIGRLISDIANQPGYRHDADRLLADFARIWNAYLRGQVVLALTIGAVVTVALLVLGVNNALGLGVLAGLLEFLPIVGPVVSAIVAILVAVFQDGNFWDLSPLWHAGIVAAVMIVIQQLENNILVPRIVGRALDLPPLVTMVAVLMGTSLAGILGAVLATPVVATIKLLGGYAWRKMLDLPPFAELEEVERTVAAEDEFKKDEESADS